MKKLLMSGLLLMATSWVPAAVAVPLDDPYQLMNEVANNTFERLNNEQSKIKADPKYLREIVEDEMLPAVDVRFTAFRVIQAEHQDVVRIS